MKCTSTDARSYTLTTPTWEPGDDAGQVFDTLAEARSAAARAYQACPGDQRDGFEIHIRDVGPTGPGRVLEVVHGWAP